VSTLKPILIVEDNPNDLELTLNALEKSRLANEVVVTRDGAEAADYLFRRNTYAGRPPGNPAVVLLDLKLPKIDGLELLRLVRANEETGRTPIVLLTSSREERDVVNGYKLGVNAYVVKPVAFNEFVQAIQDLGVFWAVLNEPPPGSARVMRNG
jgi:CheY-like chemotaxis protein